MGKTVKEEFHNVQIQLERSDTPVQRKTDLLKRWPRGKQIQYFGWMKDENEPGSSAHKHRELLSSLRHEEGISPAVYTGMINELDFSQEQKLAEFVRDTQRADYGPLPSPLRLFQHQSNHFYLCSELVYYEREGNEQNQRSHSEQIEIAKQTHQYITEFDPSLSQPVAKLHHPLKSADAVDTPPLQFALLLGSLQYGADDSIEDRSRLQPSPFLVFLHPADKSLWMVFNCFPVDEEGECRPIDSIEDPPFWRDVDLGDPVEVFREPFSVLQHGKTSSAQHINKTARIWVDGSAETEGDSSDNSRLGVEVLIDRTDRSRKMFTEPTRVRPTPCTALKTSLTSIWLAA